MNWAQFRRVREMAERIYLGHEHMAPHEAWAHAVVFDEFCERKREELGVKDLEAVSAEMLNAITELPKIKNPKQYLR